MDCGDIVAQSSISYDWEDTGLTLYTKAIKAIVERHFSKWGEIENTNVNNMTHNVSSTLQPPSSPKNTKKRPPKKVISKASSGGGEQKEKLIKTYFTNLSNNFFLSNISNWGLFQSTNK